MEDDFNKEFFGDLLSELEIDRNLNIDLPNGIVVSKREDNEKKYFFIQNYLSEEKEIDFKNYILRDTVTEEKYSGKVKIKPYEVLILEE